jgi:hypothetical protein
MADDIEKIEDHTGEALARLSGRYKAKPRIAGVVSALSNRVQDIEDVLIDYLDHRKISTAQGSLLDDIGSLVGADRMGFDDDFYRILIYIKIAENFSEGQPEPLIAAFKLMTGATKVEYKNLGGGNVEIVSNGFSPTFDTNFMLQQLNRLLAAGVSLNSVTFVDNEGAFMFDIGLGFANAAGEGGGKLSSFIPS